MKKFDNIFLLGRGAAGKSEMIDFLKKMSLEERLKNFHIFKFEEIDDFPMIWDFGAKDDEREAQGLKRLHTEKTEECYSLPTSGFRGDMLAPKLNEKIIEKYLNRPEFYNDGTLFIEFARGKGDGFEKSLNLFAPEILKQAAIFYIDVSFEESFRRNNARYEAAKKSSILCHKIPDKDMYEYFIENDWAKITDGKGSGFIKIRGLELPFVSMKNEPELPPGPEIAKRYETAFNTLFELYNSIRFSNAG